MNTEEHAARTLLWWAGLTLGAGTHVRIVGRKGQIEHGKEATVVRPPYVVPHGSGIWLIVRRPVDRAPCDWVAQGYHEHVLDLTDVRLCERRQGEERCG